MGNSSWQGIRRASPGTFPPIGQIAFKTDGTTQTDIAAVWLYLAMAGSGLFSRTGITKPGLNLKIGQGAFAAMLECLQAVAHRLG